MRIGFDIDGVLANFYSAYEKLTIEVAGQDLFGEHKYPEIPCTWNWPEHYGYSKETMREVWRRIKESNKFWLSLPTLDEVGLTLVGDLATDWNHEVYFITARPGVRVKRQTEDWFHLRIHEVPTVLISDKKGLSCAALDLELYIDDKLENIEDVEDQSSATRAYLLNRPYNRPLFPESGLLDVTRRADSLEEVLKKEGLIG